MASLQKIKQTYYISFYLGGRPFRRSLETADLNEAEAAKMQVALTLHRINTGCFRRPL